ncbi:EamA family transporter [Sphaerospermopsis sp. FACHB-1094]|uniref:EamA family transporter n=1 Tax=Sphaerospermopsis sp. FACHB-1094 TaxID=2692861 RepID=UPI0016849BF0|nr:EamA family transporter [Sphaerospermopsis sp. FACHB-1094]MBD2133192.1 EamA family transporter [Sphaerospermopsis sp. FACHB-1094]
MAPKVLKLKFSVVTLAILLQLSGAITGKYLAISLANLPVAGFWAALLILSFAARMRYWTWAGRIYQLSFLYPFISLSYIFSLIFGKILFHEEITWNKLVGSVIIVAGVLVVSKSKNQMEIKP